MPAARPRATTKLVCTIGPATEDRIGELVDAGMSVARLNFAHGTAAEHGARVTAIREVARAAGRHVAILADLPGPKVRLGPLRGGEATLETGATFTFLAGLDALEGDGDASRAATTHAGLAGDLAPGDRIQLSDGVVEVVVLSIDGNAVTTTVERGGVVRSRAGVNVPADRLSLPAIGGHDRELARLAVDLGIDLVGQSFVRTAADIVELRSLLGPAGPAIVAKIETRSAVDGFEAVAAAARRPAVPIVAVMPDERTARLLAVVRGVWPVVPADPAVAADPGIVPADRLLRDVAVRAALPPSGRAVVIAGSEDGSTERIEALAIPTGD